MRPRTSLDTRHTNTYTWQHCMHDIKRHQ